MKSEFEMLNDVKVDIDNYEEVEFENNDEIKNRMKSKIKSNNSNYKKIITASSLMAILCFGLISNEDVWANVERTWYSLQKMINIKNEEVVDYKFEINKSVESKNIKVTYKNLMIDDGNLIVEIDVDDSKFKPSEDFTQKQKEDWNLDKWVNRETFISLGDIEAYVNKEKRGILQTGQADYEYKSRNADGVTSIVSIIPLYEIENGFNVEKVDKDEFPYNIDKDRIYNIQLTTKKIHISAEMEPNEKVRYGGVVRSDWSVDLPIKGEDLIKATIKCDDYKINKNIKFEIDNLEKELYFESLYVSPIYAKLKFSTDIDGYNIGEKYNIEIKLENENGEEYQFDSMTAKFDDKKQSCEVEVEYKNIFEDSKKLQITPVIKEVYSEKTIEQEPIVININ
ncbi:MAG: DUF4179 domain-containing protein [Terrisporobacter sp.]|uniref:DUF4179 domain-containing protein n=1 Tax=Terrisporobacter sp. TaxID=1965305 RepID=UPI002A91A122|nr:DUF4179 domain-containing protein [Terrisporobacter sp.]MDY6154680.1 DUF4179 domain-containing protein [Terrisporobacter sp.]